MFSLISQFARYSSSYNYNYDYPSSTGSAASAGIGIAIILGMLFVGLVVYLFFSFCLYNIFKKAKRDDAWAAFVPLYNTYVLFEIAGRPGWWVFLGLIPIFGGLVFFVLSIMAMIDLAKSFGKDTAYAILLILLPIIGYPILAFGDATYKGPAGPDAK